MLVVPGNLTQMVHTPDELLESLARRDFQVALFDNRDSGRSTHLPDGPKYDLRDMADDAVAVLDALGWPSAHVLGVAGRDLVRTGLECAHQPAALADDDQDHGRRE
jgi:pimeloyl-ACP methyl ester carboxylesterase